MTLTIPDITDDQDPLSAALAYAKAGWYVLPVDRRTKHAGSVLGKGWPSKSSRDPETIIGWFSGTDHALALHVGRSGAVVFDVDDPEALPDLLRAALAMVPAPHQSTREHTPGRGHHLYAAPPGRLFGNSLGRLGKGWGEVRGRNGIIVVAPSEHEKADEGGRYTWVRTGPLPLLPGVLAEQLPDAGEAAEAATDREIRAFLGRHTGRERPELLYGVLTQVGQALAAGESRHQLMLRAAAGAMREAAAGLYPALEAATRLQEVFVAALAVSRDGAERTLPARQAQAEFRGILSWAVAQTAAADLAALRADVDERLPGGEEALRSLIAPGAEDGQPPPFDAGEPEDDGEDLATVHQLPVTLTPADGTATGEDQGDEELDLEALAFEAEVERELKRIRVREEAARRARRQRAGTAVRPRIVPLDEFLGVPDEPVRYRIGGLLPVGGRAMLAAQFKAGKTTLVGNLVRSLVDGDAFLGRFEVEPSAGRVVLLDDELDEGMVRRWLRDQGIEHASAAAVVSLRGRLSSFDLIDPEVRSEWACALREIGASIVVLDCLAPILDALGLSEDKEAGRFLVAFDEMLKEANVQEAILVHHMGHSGERSRGASRLRDWPDVEWRLVREKSDDGEMDPAAPRYFSAYGRDVEVPESRLEFDPSTRRLTLVGGSRADHKHDATTEAIVEHLTLHPGQSGRQIEEALGEELGRNEVRKALKKAVRDKVLRTSPGRGGALLHWVAGVEKGAPMIAGSAPPAQDQRRTTPVTRIFSAPPASGDDLEKNPSAPPVRRGGGALNPQVTEVVRHLATSAPPDGAVSAPVRLSQERRRTGAQSHRDHDPRDPYDLLPPPADPDWVWIDGQRYDTRTGELLPDSTTEVTG